MPTILQNHCVLAVHNVKESARFYVDALGFSIVAEPPGWIFVKKDNCMIMLGECPNDIPPADLGCHSYFAYLRVDDASAYHAELTAKGVSGIGTIADKPWGDARISVDRSRWTSADDWTFASNTTSEDLPCVVIS